MRRGAGGVSAGQMMSGQIWHGHVWRKLPHKFYQQSLHAAFLSLPPAQCAFCHFQFNMQHHLVGPLHNRVTFGGICGLQWNPFQGSSQT